VPHECWLLTMRQLNTVMPRAGVDHLLRSSTSNSIDPEPGRISYLVVLEPQQIPVRIDLKETSGFVLTELHWETKFHPTETLFQLHRGKCGCAGCRPALLS
jgi:hypothetical protein